MSAFRRSIAVSLALLFCRLLYPCSIVIIGGYSPTVVSSVNGTVVGSDRFDLMGNSHNEERHSIAVPDAIISVKVRTDTAFFKKGEVKYPPGVKRQAGNLKEWQCGSEIATAKTDQAGSFAFPDLKPGKYCLDIIGPKPVDNAHMQMSESFLIDVVDSAPKATLVADVSPRWPDCSGGSSLTPKPLK